MLRKYENRQTFGHSGGFPGYITNTMAVPSERLVVTALTNAIDGPAEGIVSGIYRILTYFEQHATAQTHNEHNWSMLQGSYANLWGAMNIVAIESRLFRVIGIGWDPLAVVEKLEWVEGHTFKIAETSSGASEGELVYFEIQSGLVKRVIHSGSTYLPRKAWREKTAGRDEVGFMH